MSVIDVTATTIVTSPFLPLFCVIAFYLHEYLLFILVEFATLKLMNEYHCLTSSYWTKISSLFHLLITFFIGLNGWIYHLYDYICLFILIFLMLISIWILALSNLYPFNDNNNNNNNNRKKKKNISINSSFNTSIINDSFFNSPSPNKSTLSSSLPFTMPPHDTFIFDEIKRNQSLNGSIINLNKLQSSTSNTETLKMRKLCEPTNFFQGLVGFSSVHSLLNFLNIFDENKKMEIMDAMTKQNFFNLSSIHFSSMIIDLFSFILIPFFIFHIFLLYQSQHSIIPVCYVLIVLFISQYGENIINYLLLSLNPEYYDNLNIIWNKKNILSYSISTKYSLEGLLISIITSCIASFILYICFGIIVYGPSCSSVNINKNNNNQCFDDNTLCLFCNSSFVKMRFLNHLILGCFISIQSILGSLFIDIIIKSYSYKLVEIYETNKKDKKLLIWLQRLSPFIFAFAVTFYYLLL